MTVINTEPRLSTTRRLMVYVGKSVDSVHLAHMDIIKVAASNESVVEGAYRLSDRFFQARASYALWR